jgi:hypothetical protein
MNDRKVVQIAVTSRVPFEFDESRQTDQEVTLTALCDDGSIWSIRPDQFQAEWNRLPAIPQDK